MEASVVHILSDNAVNSSKNLEVRPNIYKFDPKYDPIILCV